MKTKNQLDVAYYFYFTSYALNMFWTLIYPSSGAYDYSVELPYWSCVLGTMCVGVSVWIGLKPLAEPCDTDTTPTPSTLKYWYTSNQEHMSNVVIRQNSHKLLKMDILMSETCWAHKKWNKNSKWHQVGLSFSTVTMIHGPINIRCCTISVLFSTPCH